MMFLCIGYFNGAAMDALPEPDLNRVMDECGPVLESFYDLKELKMDVGLGLETFEVQRADGRIVVNDSYTRDSQERIGNVFLVEADTIEDAAMLAVRHPAIQVEQGEALGWRMEVRQVRQLEKRMR
jgi:hypothetical protein